MADPYDQPIDPRIKHQLELLLADPTFQKALQNYRYEDHKHSVAYLAGSETQGNTVNFDRDFSHANDAGMITFRGRPLNRKPYVWVHEAVEGAILNHQFSPGVWILSHDGLSQDAHRIALLAERLAVEDTLGPNAWNDYTDPMEPWIKQDTEHEVPDPPPNIQRIPISPRRAKVKQ